MDTRRIALAWARTGEGDLGQGEEQPKERMPMPLEEGKPIEESEKSSATEPHEEDGADSPEGEGQKDGPTSEEGAPETAPQAVDIETNPERKPPLWMSAALPVAAGALALVIMLWVGRRTRPKRFHGILTHEGCPGIEVRNPGGCQETVQDVIDRTDGIKECMEELRESGAETWIPASSKMELVCADEEGEETVRACRADEKRLLRMLRAMKEAESAGVRIFDDRTGMDVRLRYKIQGTEKRSDSD